VSSIDTQRRQATHIPLGRVVLCTTRKQRRRANCGDREPVKLFHRAKTTKPFRRAEKPFSWSHEETGKRMAGIKDSRIKQWGSIMWDIIISLIYRQSCRNYLAAVRKQSAPGHLWA
jgi:hypothetical protein